MTTTVFFKGCPLPARGATIRRARAFSRTACISRRCRHCLDCAAQCPQQAIREVDGALTTSDACTLCGHCAEVCLTEARQIAGRRYTLRELMAEVEKDLVFFDDSGGGVTLSGGEPLSQPTFAAAILDACREHGILTALGTCGFAQHHSRPDPEPV